MAMQCPDVTVLASCIWFLGICVHLQSFQERFKNSACRFSYMLFCDFFYKPTST